MEPEEGLAPLGWGALAVQFDAYCSRERSWLVVRQALTYHCMATRESLYTAEVRGYEASSAVLVHTRAS